MNKIKLSSIILVIVLLAIAFYVFITSIPAINYSVPNSSLEKDFSAYYEGAWRFVHSPDSIYYPNPITDYPITNPQHFRYPPFFLYFMLPFLLTGYRHALQAFDVFQFLLLPLIAFFIYKIFQPKNWKQFALMDLALIFTLLEPIPINPTGIHLNYSVGYDYFYQWNLGQSKVLELFLIIAALYYSKKGSWIGSFLLCFSAFDPRFTLMAIPLFAYFVWKSKSLNVQLQGLCIAFMVLVFPFIIYHGTFVQYIFLRQWKILTFYNYEWIPFLSILILSLAYFMMEVDDTFKNQKQTSNLNKSASAIMASN